MFSFCFRGVAQLNSSNPIGSASKTARFGASVFVKELIKDSIECCVSVQGLYAAGLYHGTVKKSQWHSFLLLSVSPLKSFVQTTGWALALFAGNEPFFFQD